MKSAEHRSPSERPVVLGVGLDGMTRCAHYGSALDVVAIRVSCCGEYYACKECHDALADHPLVPWPSGANSAVAILCGACGTELTIEAYLKSDNNCPDCGAGFNPGCSRHYHFYFSDS